MKTQILLRARPYLYLADHQLNQDKRKGFFVVVFFMSSSVKLHEENGLGSFYAPVHSSGSFLKADNKRPDQTVQMRSLIRAFVVRICEQKLYIQSQLKTPNHYVYHLISFLSFSTRALALYMPCWKLRIFRLLIT